MEHKEEITLHHSEDHIFAKPIMVSANNIKSLTDQFGGCTIERWNDNPINTIENSDEISILFHGGDEPSIIERIITGWENAEYRKPNLPSLRRRFEF